MPIPHRYREAAKEGFNLVGLAAAVGLSFATLTPIPLLVALVGEAAYLIFVPDSKWYEARLSQRYDAEVLRRRQQLVDKVFPLLTPELQERFRRLEATRRAIDAQPMEDQTWFREVLRKLDYLLEKFLLFSSREVEFCRYLASVQQEVSKENARDRPPDRSDFILEPVPERRLRRGRGPASQSRPVQAPPAPPAPQPSPADTDGRWVEQAVADVQGHYEGEMAEIRKLLEGKPDLDTQAVLDKRLDVLQRRREFLDKLARIVTNLHHQLQLLEDTFGLINDEIRARAPEQVLSDIEDVVWQTDSMTQVLEEIGAYDQMVARLST